MLYQLLAVTDIISIVALLCIVKTLIFLICCYSGCSITRLFCIKSSSYLYHNPFMDILTVCMISDGFREGLGWAMAPSHLPAIQNPSHLC